MPHALDFVVFNILRYVCFSIWYCILLCHFIIHGKEWEYCVGVDIFIDLVFRHGVVVVVIMNYDTYTGVPYVLKQSY